MVYKEFSRHVGKAGLSLAEFARLIGVAPKSVTNYAGQPDVPTLYAIVAVLMGEAADRGVDFRHVLHSFRAVPNNDDRGVANIAKYRAKKQTR